ncbi:MAG: PAS domain S-box protein, partial [Pseudomonadota bacterium]
VGLGVTLGVETRQQFREIGASWNDHAGGPARKGALISEIRGYLGFGGIIHSFKNYVLRQEQAYLENTQRQIAQFRHAVARFQALETSPEERAAVAAIARTIDAYEDRLPIAIEAADEGWLPTRTDGLVRVDDTEAVAALAELERLWRETQARSTERIAAAVDEGDALIQIGFGSVAALVLASLVLGTLILLLVRDLRRAIGEVAHELAERRKLERSEERLATIVEQSPATIILTDTSARIQYANRKFEEVTGWRRDEVLGRTPAFLQSGHTSDQTYERIRTQLDKGERWHGVFRNRRRDGSSYWADTVLLPLRAPDGSVQNFVGIAEDVTEARRARDQVVRAQKLEAVGQLAGGIAHDFNNILTTIVGASHLAALDAEEGSDLAREIEQINIAARRAQSLVRELLSFARREPGEAQPLVVHDIVVEVTTLLRAAAPRLITLECPEPAARHTVMGDPTHLHQIVMNLCRNAAEAIGGRTGTITVSIAACAEEDAPAPHEAGWVKLVVADDGPGMSDQTIARVFEPFFTTKPIGKGSGLGLAVVFGLVEEMGGRITVDSKPGEGARFTVFLQAAAEQAPAQIAPSEPLPRGDEWIILIDDEAEVAGTLRRQLIRLGYRVDAFTSPLVAYERFRAHPDRYDLAISDIVMPEMTGEELVDRMRRERPNLPALLCTGYRPETTPAGPDTPTILDKPVNPIDLARAVRTLLDKRRISPVLETST